jgi:hypothetical protein
MLVENKPETLYLGLCLAQWLSPHYIRTGIATGRCQKLVEEIET